MRMRPLLWCPSIGLSVKEEQVVKRIKKAKLFVFLRQHRHLLFDEAFQQELAQMYQANDRGQPPIAPAQLALATILQAYAGISDDEVIKGRMQYSSVFQA
jgi:transposase